MFFHLSGCGGELRKPFGNISTPGYPSSYPVSTTCEWEIEVQPGKSIELTILEYDIEGNVACTFDSLKVGFLIYVRIVIRLNSGYVSGYEYHRKVK